MIFINSNLLINREQSIAIVCIMCLLAGNLVSKISPVAQKQSNSYLYNSSPPTASVTQQEEKEPEIIIETVVETRIVNFDQEKRELTDDVAHFQRMASRGKGQGNVTIAQALQR